MLYQIGLILILIVLALLIAKKFKSKNNKEEALVYEDEMSEDQLKELDEELDNYWTLLLVIYAIPCKPLL